MIYPNGGLAQRDAEVRKGKDLKIVSDAADSILQVLSAKVNKQAKAKVLKFETCSNNPGPSAE